MERLCFILVHRRRRAMMNNWILTLCYILLIDCNKNISEREFFSTPPPPPPPDHIRIKLLIPVMMEINWTSFFTLFTLPRLVSLSVVEDEEEEENRSVVYKALHWNFREMSSYFFIALSSYGWRWWWWCSVLLRERQRHHNNISTPYSSKAFER